MTKAGSRQEEGRKVLCYIVEGCMGAPPAPLATDRIGCPRLSPLAEEGDAGDQELDRCGDQRVFVVVVKLLSVRSVDLKEKDSSSEDYLSEKRLRSLLRTH